MRSRRGQTRVLARTLPILNPSSAIRNYVAQWSLGRRSSQLPSSYSTSEMAVDYNLNCTATITAPRITHDFRDRTGSPKQNCFLPKQGLSQGKPASLGSPLVKEPPQNSSILYKRTAEGQCGHGPPPSSQLQSYTNGPPC